MAKKKNMVTVGQLIEMLSKKDWKAPIMVDNTDSRCRAIEEMSPILAVTEIDGGRRGYILIETKKKNTF